MPHGRMLLAALPPYAVADLAIATMATTEADTTNTIERLTKMAHIMAGLLEYEPQDRISKSCHKFR